LPKTQKPIFEKTQKKKKLVSTCARLVEAAQTNGEFSLLCFGTITVLRVKMGFFML
jgi:hypothetical protein